MISDICKIQWESVTATDDSTVVFKLKEPALTALNRILVDDHGYIVAREVVEQFGDIQDWRNVTGTGPYQLTDVLEGSSWTYTKVDGYWGFDPKYPANRLPYADTVELLIVNDPTAITSLIRSGQADFSGFALNSNLTSPRISDKGWIGQGSDQDLAELARLHALFDVEMRLGHHS